MILHTETKLRRSHKTKGIHIIISFQNSETKITPSKIIYDSAEAGNFAEDDGDCF